jgi:hypothetical protein
MTPTPIWLLSLYEEEIRAQATQIEGRLCEETVKSSQLEVK